MTPKPPSLALLGLLAFTPSSLALLALSASYPGVSYTPTSAWFPYCLAPGPQQCFDACAAYYGDNDAVFTFVFPSVSTTFQWWGYPVNNAGQATVCFDGATSGSDATP